MAFKIKKRLSTAQRREREFIERGSAKRPQWIIGAGAVVLLGYAATKWLEWEFSIASQN